MVGVHRHAGVGDLRPGGRALVDGRSGTVPREVRRAARCRRVDRAVVVRVLRLHRFDVRRGSRPRSRRGQLARRTRHVHRDRLVLVVGLALDELVVGAEHRVVGVVGHLLGSDRQDRRGVVLHGGGVDGRRLEAGGRRDDRSRFRELARRVQRRSLVRDGQSRRGDEQQGGESRRADHQGPLRDAHGLGLLSEFACVYEMDILSPTLHTRKGRLLLN